MKGNYCIQISKEVNSMTIETLNHAPGAFSYHYKT